jgi:hypothetical protein
VLRLVATDVLLSRATAVLLAVLLTVNRRSKVATRLKVSNTEGLPSKATAALLAAPPTVNRPSKGAIRLKVNNTAHPRREVARRKVAPVATLASSLSMVHLPQVAVTRGVVS